MLGLKEFTSCDFPKAFATLQLVNKFWENKNITDTKPVDLAAILAGLLYHYKGWSVSKTFFKRQRLSASSTVSFLNLTLPHLTYL